MTITADSHHHNHQTDVALRFRPALKFRPSRYMFCRASSERLQVGVGVGRYTLWSVSRRVGLALTR
eukprot:10842840-Alexandrium_andersonii.AAC.1